VPPVATTELGSVRSWASYSSGSWDDSEQTPELQFPLSIRVYDAMRRQDAQVRAVLWALTLPLRRPIWSLDPQGARPEVVAMIAEDLDLPVLGAEATPPLRMGGRFQWSDHLRLALLSLSYGFMAFEQVYRVENGRARLRKLAPRFPASIVAVNVADDGGLTSIEQANPKPGAGQKPTITIPVDRLAMYVIDREGGTWTGNSVLRACYKDWLLKDRTLRVAAQSFERNAMGVPVIEGQEGATQAQLDEYQALASAYRGGEKSGGALPHGARLRLVGVEGSTPDPLPFLHLLNTEIAKSVQAQFMELGTSGNGGNRALGTTQLDFFAAAVDGLGAQLADTTTQHVVEDLVDLNWGSNEPAPRVVVQSINAETDITVEQVGDMIRLGLLTMDDDLESWARRKGKLPAKPDSSVITPAASEAAGALIRAGFEPAAALAALGLPAIAHTGRLPVTVQGAGGSAPVAAGRRVAASAPGAEPMIEKLTSHYAPRIATALSESTDVDAIVAALEGDGA
jgi:hypothetical protein